jgi:hypothetical protein
MNDLSQLKPKLVRLKLSGVLETLEQRIAQAMEEKWEYSQFLLNLLTDEVIRRDNRQLTLRVGRSPPASRSHVYLCACSPLPGK